MIPLPEKSVIPLFGQSVDHSFAPTKVVAAVARNGGQGRPPGRRASALPLRAASTPATLPSFGAIACIIAIFISPVLVSDAAQAARASSAARRTDGLPADPFADFIAEASKRFAVPMQWIRSVMRVESAGEVRAQSRKGALGLMQIMPRTWSELRARYDLGADPYDPHDNILAGAAYIRELFNRYGAPGFLAAYNAGPGRYESHLAIGRPLPDETQNYMAMLAPAVAGKQAEGKVVAVVDSPTLNRSPLFVVGPASRPSNDRHAYGLRTDGPSNVHPVVDLSALVPQSGNLFVHHASEARSQ